VSAGRRVVVTGLGVIAPNGNGVAEFERALREGRSGLRHREDMQELGFGCQVAAVPEGVEALAERSFSAEELFAMNAIHRYAALVALEAWQDAGLARPAHPPVGTLSTAYSRGPGSRQRDQGQDRAGPALSVVPGCGAEAARGQRDRPPRRRQGAAVPRHVPGHLRRPPRDFLPRHRRPARAP